MKLEHANITVRSIDDAIIFLSAAFPDCRVRGGGSIHGDPRLGRWVHYGNDDFYIALQENVSHSGRTDSTYLNDGINHLGFTTDELDNLMLRLTNAGFELSPSSALDSHPGRRRAYYFDANKIEWEFIEYLSDDPNQRNDYTR